MLNSKLHAREDDQDLAEEADGLLRSISRALFMGFIAIYTVMLLATAVWPVELGLRLWAMAPVGILICILAMRLVEWNTLLALTIWLASVILVITLSIVLFRRPEFAFFYALMPFIATITIGPAAGIAVQGLVVGILLLFFPTIPLPIDPVIEVSSILGGVVCGLMGWISTRSLLTVTQWALYSRHQAEKNLEEVREHRAELAKVVKELDQAYHHLERTNNMLVIARSEAEEAKESRNRFALAISHELRTPLNFVIGFSELMVNSPGAYGKLETWPAGLYEDIQEIYRSSKHLLRLVNDVLDLGQIEKMQMALYKEWMDPAQVVRETVDMMKPAFTRKGLTLQMEAESGLPKVFVDHTRIRQALLNLTNNSLRFTEHGGVKLTVRQGPEKDLVFCVEDSGIGIAEQDIPKIFEPFQQVGNDSWRRREGFGLGVTISRQFIELHGGKMWIESTVGVGTRSYFTLPILAAGNPDTLIEQLEQKNIQYWDRQTRRASSERMVIVLSNDPTSGNVLASYLDDYGLITVMDSSELAQKVEEILPSAILIDRDLADDPGVMADIRNLHYDLPVITFGFPGNPSMPRHLPEGVANYLVKPIDYQTLSEAVRRLGENVKSLLVVDDDPGMQRFADRTFQALDQNAAAGGYRLMTAASIGAALDRIENDRPDAVLLDLTLPDGNGMDLLRHIRRLHIPVIIITAHDWIETPILEVQDALKVILPRPLYQNELHSILKGLLESIRPKYPESLIVPGR